MPSKKNTPNGFFFYMQSLRPLLKREGILVKNNKQLADLAGPRWAALTKEEKEPYMNEAKREKECRQYTSRPDAMDCTGQYISQRVDNVQIKETRRRNVRKRVVESWLGKDVTVEKFYMVDFMSLCDLPDDRFMPCEMGLVEYSLQYGIIRSFHKFIYPGQIPLGFRYEAMRKSEATHKIPIEGLATDSYSQIYEDLLDFLSSGRQNDGQYPPLYCKASQSKLVEFSLIWLAHSAGSSNKLKHVYELEGLVCDLFMESGEAFDGKVITLHNAMEILSTTVFDYNSGTRCKWHEEIDNKFCALGTVKRYCFCMSDVLCRAFDIELTSKHVPERPDGDTCVVITPWMSTGRYSKNDGQTIDVQERTGYRNGYVNKNKKHLYTERGPTYDQDVLKSAEVREVATPTKNLPSTLSTGLHFYGRGRGRGRAALYNSLRNPFVPGGTSSILSVTAGPGTTEGVRTSSSPWSGTLGAGRGQEVRTPHTTPIGWAGGKSAPHPSSAPFPPTSWQLPSSASSAIPSSPAVKLEQDFESFSLFDKDDYGY